MEANPNAGQAIVPWQEYTEDDASQMQEELKKGSTQFWTPPVGENELRIAPAPLGSARKNPILTTNNHQIDVPGKDEAIRFNCPRIMAGKRCPSCEKADALRRSGTPEDFEAAKIFLPKIRCFANVLVRKEQEKGLQAWGFGQKIADRLAELRKNPKIGGNWADPTAKGFDILLTRQGTTRKNTRYEVAVLRAPSVMLDDYNLLVELIKHQPPIEMYASVLSYEECLALLNGEDLRDVRDAARERAAHGGGRTVDTTATRPAAPPPPAQRGPTVDDVAAAGGQAGDDLDVPF